MLGFCSRRNQGIGHRLLNAIVPRRKELAMSDFKYCPSCGSQHNATAQFCQTCGARYAEEERPAPKEQSRLRRLLNSPVFLGLILGSLFLGYYALTGEFPGAKKSAQSSSATTLAAYESIQTGITYDR